VLIADEPTSELDPGNRERVLALFADLARRGHVVAIASDDPEVVAGCGSVVVLERGTVTARRTQRDIAAEA
jgi:putative ABC transport system ATP-binding protein